MKTTAITRPPAVAGRFYPADRVELAAFVASALEKGAETGGEVRALAAPHAGYPFSGGLCGAVYASVTSAPERMWLMGPSHYVALEDGSTCTHHRLATPLGETRVDREGRDETVHAGGLVYHDRAHGPEHALETHLPFLQTRWPEVPVIPVLTSFRDDVGAVDWLETMWREGDLLAVSTDLSHFHPAEKAERLDTATGTAVANLDADAIGPEDACGWVALRALLRLARRRDWRPVCVGRAHSGQTTGDDASVVGYGGWVFVEDV